MKIQRSYRFEASHQLPRHPGACRRLHGHSYRFIVQVRGTPDDDQGMVLDFFDLDRIVAERVLDKLDHHHLNDLIPNPTAEWIAVWIWRALVGQVNGLSQIELYEVETASVIYAGEFEAKA